MLQAAPNLGFMYFCIIFVILVVNIIILCLSYFSKTKNISCKFVVISAVSIFCFSYFNNDFSADYKLVDSHLTRDVNLYQGEKFSDTNAIDIKKIDEKEDREITRVKVNVLHEKEYLQPNIIGKYIGMIVAVYLSISFSTLLSSTFKFDFENEMASSSGLRGFFIFILISLAIIVVFFLPFALSEELMACFIKFIDASSIFIGAISSLIIFNLFSFVKFKLNNKKISFEGVKELVCQLDSLVDSIDKYLSGVKSKKARISKSKIVENKVKSKNGSSDKFKKQQKELERELKDLKNKQNEIKEKQKELEREQGDLKNKQNEIKGKQNEIKEKQKEIKENQEKLEKELENFK